MQLEKRLLSFGREGTSTSTPLLTPMPTPTPTPTPTGQSPPYDSKANISFLMITLLAIFHRSDIRAICFCLLAVLPYTYSW
jgi:hypothetical protein